MGCFYNWTTAFCQKEFQKAVIMQDRQLVPFSVSKLHFMYNTILLQARTGLIFAVARSRHGQDLEVDHTIAGVLPGPFQVGTVWQREQLGRVVSVDSFTFPVPFACIVAVTVSLSHCPFQQILTSTCALYFLCLPILLSSHQQGEGVVSGTWIQLEH